MIVSEASEHFYVKGCSYQANRYYVLSEELRERGWTGVGDQWCWNEDGFTLTFEDALSYEDLHRWYEWNVCAEALHIAVENLRHAAIPALTEIGRAARRFLDSPAWRALAVWMDEQRVETYTAYEWAWFQYADETGGQ